jgi:hypothetical protein
MSSIPAFNVTASIRYRDNVDTTNTYYKHFAEKELQNELFDLSFTQEENIIDVNAILKRAIVVELFSVSFSINKQGAVQCIDRNYQQTILQGELWNNDLTPLHIKYQFYGKQYLLSNTQGSFSHSIKDEGAHFDLTIYLDAAAMHPSWSHRKSEKETDATRLLHGGHNYEISFSLIQTNDIAVPVLSRYPFGAEAGFIITDHCDYDQADTLRTFLAHWKGKGLKLTKGVFAKRSDYNKDNLAASLEDEAYYKLIKELQADGSEIAPHALNQSGNIDGQTFKATLDKVSTEFDCCTWIDHGSYLKYCYSVGGAENAEYRLVDKLKSHHYSSLWSYHDAPVDATQSLNIFSSSGNNYKHVFKNALRGKWSVAAHYFKTIVERNENVSGNRSVLVKLMGAARKNLVSKKSIWSLMKDVRTAFKYSSGKHLPYTTEELEKFSPVLFTESKQPLNQYKDDELILFTSQEVVHTQDAYTPAALNKLIAEKGLHIGHTYLLNTLPYINGIFDKQTKQLTNEWKTFVVALSEYVKEGNVWDPNIHEFIDYNKQLNSLSFTHNSSRSILVKNSSNKAIEGLSFVIPTNNTSNISWGNTQPDSRNTKQNETIFWGTVPANNSVTISW